MENHKEARNTARENVRTAEQKVAEVRKHHAELVQRANAALSRAKDNQDSAIQNAKRDVKRLKGVLATEMRLYNASKIKKSAPSQTLQKLQAKIAARKLKNDTPKPPKQPRPKPEPEPAREQEPEHKSVCTCCFGDFTVNSVYTKCGHAFLFCPECIHMVGKWATECGLCRRSGTVVRVFGVVEG